MLCFNESLDRLLTLIVNRDCDDRESFWSELLLQLDEFRHLVAACRAPRSPEADENNFPLVTFHVHPAFIDRRQDGVWHGLIHVRDVAGIVRENLCEPGEIGMKITQGAHATDQYDEKQQRFFHTGHRDPRDSTVERRILA